MKLHRYLIILIALLVLFSATAAQSSQGDDEDTRLFPTGHRVSGEFLSFYNSVDDPERLFGNPITEVLQDPFRENIQVQYFERVRMEYDPAQPAGQRVGLADLGIWLYDETQRGLPVNFSVSTPMCRHFPVNDKYVCFGFLQFYDRYNGDEIFGEPVSNVEYVNSRLVQYFEHIRLEWRNEMPVNEKVVLTEIGRMGFDLMYDNPNLLRRVFIPNVPVTPNVKAFVARPLLAAGEEQHIDILVRDQFLQPIPDSDVQIAIIYGDKRKVNIQVSQPTDNDGLTRISFPINYVQPNEVIEIIVTAQAPGGQTCTGQTWFRIWW